MNKIISILNQEGQLVVTSRQISEDFEKEHSSVVIRAIENLIKELGGSGQNCTHLFIESQYKNEQNKQWYKEYLLTRDGFSLLVMGFTGAKALSWKLKYIEAFNKMEETIKGQALNTSELSPELQMFNQMFKAIANNELEQKKLKAAVEETKEEIKGIREAVTLEPNQWRKDTATLINKIANKLGGFEHIKPIRDEAYTLLNNTYGVDINRRLLNKKKNMALEGCSKSKIDKVNYLDVIAEDKKLINGYINIIGRLAVKYGIKN